MNETIIPAERPCQWKLDSYSALIFHKLVSAPSMQGYWVSNRAPDAGIHCARDGASVQEMGNGVSNAASCISSAGAPRVQGLDRAAPFLQFRDYSATAVDGVLASTFAMLLAASSTASRVSSSREEVMRTNGVERLMAASTGDPAG